MSIAKETIPEDKNKNLLSDDPSDSSNDDQDQKPDHDDFSSSLTDETEVSIQAELSLAKEVNDDTTLEELEAMYGSSSDAISNNVSTDDPVLDELEALLSDDSVDSVVNSITDEIEISEAAEQSSNDSDVSGLSTFDELKDFLGEMTLYEDSESEDSASTDHAADGVSVFDELSDILGEAKINNSDSVSDASVLPDEVDEYLSSIELENETSSNDETVAIDSVLDDLNELLGKSDDVDTELPAAGTEKSVLVEFAAYMDGLSDLPGVATAAPAEEAPAGETETESVIDEVDSTSDTLEQLEAMLNESSAYTDDEPGETIQLNEDDSLIEQEIPQRSVNNEEEKHKVTSIVKNRTHPADVKTEGLVQNSLHETENNNRRPIVGMSLFVLAVIGFVVFWSLSADQDSQENRLQLSQGSSPGKPVVVSTEAESLAQTEQHEVSNEIAGNKFNELPVQQIKPVPDRNEESLGLLNDPVIDTESSITNLPLAVEKQEQPGPVQSASPIASEKNTTQLSKQPASDLKDKTNNSWSVHLFAYSKASPPVSEFKFLDNANIPYEINKTTIKGKVWYRVFVNTNSGRSAAEKYAEMLKQKFAIKGIWLSKN